MANKILRKFTLSSVIRRLDVQLRAVFCDGAPREFYAALQKNVGDSLVAQRFFGGMFLKYFFDFEFYAFF